MAGGSTSEEMDAVGFDDVTPDKPVSIYDLDEDLPTRAQSSEEIAQFQQLAREKREKRAAAAHRSFAPPQRDGDISAVSNRPVPRESGPVRIETPSAPRVEEPKAAPPPAPAEDEMDLDAMLEDVAAGIERLPPAPRVPFFEPHRGSLETIGQARPASRARPRVDIGRRVGWTLFFLAAAGLVALAVYAWLR
jgi:hypothetical protein